MTSHDLQETAPEWYRPQPRSPISVYSRETIANIQRTLMCTETGEWDEPTIAHLKGLQQLFGITPTGVVDLDTAIQIERLRNRYGGNDNL
jgi:hypothetical protein